MNIISSPCTILKLFDIEYLGTECRCDKCPIGGKGYTLKEEPKLFLIEKNIKFHDDHWLATYTWIRSPLELPDNYWQIFTCMKQIEKRLKNDIEWGRKYCQQIDDMINRCVAMKLTLERTSVLYCSSRWAES